MTDLVLTTFPDSLLERVDSYIKLLEELNPGRTWSRTSAISTLLVRALAEVEGSELRWSRRTGRDRRDRGRGFERRQGRGDRRTVAYPAMIDLVIEQILKTHVEPDMRSSGTWRDRHNVDDI
ncbi:MAG: hypothetical protein BMS9Abin37_3035 [Acidobacteriota bacterium]|nr:MAG: hypothetical protein BMS9Abin37_3035 [Acidobacteriota bacterium]